MNNNIFMVFLWIFITIPCDAETLGSIDIGLWGYQDYKHAKYKESICSGGSKPDFSEFREIKSLEHSKELSDTYYRFTLIKEVYSTPSDANSRMKFINSKEFPNSVVSKSCALTGGFVEGKAIYLVHTDVGVFGVELTNLISKLKVIRE